MPVLDPETLFRQTGYRQGKRQAAWLRTNLGIDAPLGPDGRPRVTQEAIVAAELRRSTAAAAPTSSPPPGAAQPAWRRRI